jgi:hypothetical protein
VERDVRALAAMQNDDGGFGFWKRGDESWPYVSIHAAHALCGRRRRGTRCRRHARRALATCARVPHNRPPGTRPT